MHLSDFAFFFLLQLLVSFNLQQQLKAEFLSWKNTLIFLKTKHTIKKYKNWVHAIILPPSSPRPSEGNPNTFHQNKSREKTFMSWPCKQDTSSSCVHIQSTRSHDHMGGVWCHTHPHTPYTAEETDYLLLTNIINGTHAHKNNNSVLTQCRVSLLMST